MPKTGFFGQKPVSRGLGSPSHIFFANIYWALYHSAYFNALIPNMSLLLRWSAEKHEKTAKNLSKTLRIWNPYNSGPWSLGIFAHLCASLRIYTSTRHMLENISWKFQLERTLAKISALTILNTSLVHVHAKIFSIIFSLEKWLKRKIFFINRKLRCSAFIIY
jgi:hypothetical protein